MSCYELELAMKLYFENVSQLSWSFAEPLPGCPSYTDFVNIPIEVSDSCFATCPVNTTVRYLCDRYGFIAPFPAETQCTDAYTWRMGLSLEYCPPTGELSSPFYCAHLWISIILEEIQREIKLNVLLVATCPAISRANGNINFNDSTLENGAYPVGTMASLTCNEGYFLIGPESTICKASGAWSEYGSCSKLPFCFHTIGRNF